MRAVRYRATVVSVAAVLGVFVVSVTVAAWRQAGRRPPDEPALPLVVPVDAAGVPRISALDLMRISGGGNVLIVDVRGADAFNLRHIAGAIHVPLPDVERRANELRAFARGRLIVTYCSCPTEHSSAEAGFALMKQGVRVNVLVGGLSEWVRQGGPTAAGS
ncbi:MAG TPA: rhodanese-like domain-containing protein [Vicinamibacterales bacterium]|nr:rhodanese-like domain-containing protein [Vicinamibacterales bacterium]